MIHRLRCSRSGLVVAGLVGSVLCASCGTDQETRTDPSGASATAASPASGPPPEASTPAAPSTAAPASTEPAPTTSPSVATPAPSPEPSAASGSPDVVVGTIVRFTGSNTTVDVTIVEDNATVRSFLARLPLTVEFEEFKGREKIGYPPDGLDVVESGHDSENGDLIYYVPWGNLGFYYNAAGIEFDNNVVLIGRYDATPQQLVGIEGNVSISLVTVPPTTD